MFDGNDPETQGLPSELTESDGKFTLKDLTPGQYRLTVSRNGYSQQSYGQRTPNSSGKIINLASGDAMKNVVFRMIPAATVTGRVRDSLGEPVPGVAVSLMKIQQEENRTALLSLDSAETDDRGEYRLFWIEPGRYYLKVSRADQFFPRRKVITDPTMLSTYYPGVLDAARATAIEVQPGSELAAMDIVLPKYTAHWIRGRVVDAATGKPPKSVSLSVSPRQQGGTTAITDLSDRDAVGADYNPATGTFAIRNVVPGSYWLSANSNLGFDAPISAQTLAEARTGADLMEMVWSGGATAQIPIEMTAADLNDVVVTLSLGVSIPVRLRVEGPDFATIKDMDKIRVELAPVAESMNAYRQSTRLSSEGVARVDNVPAGEYRLRVSVPKSADLYVKEILYGRTNALNEPVQITDQPSGLAVLLSDKGGRIEGVLTDALGQPVGGEQVVLVPDPTKREIRTATTDRDGRFVFRGLPPGGYKAFSWEVMPENVYDDGVRSKDDALGKLLQIQESSKVSLELKIIPETRQ
jgi:5-hydroxyisourate hydrolase-like protein (transthyretin family)